MTPSVHDTPRVLVFPPAVPVATIIIAVVLQRFWFLHLFDRIPSPVGKFIGDELIVLGAALLAGGADALRRAGTPIRPSQPALKLVEDGVYRWTRIPFYVGGSVAIMGCAFLFDLDWLPLLFAISLAVLHFGIVLPEEAYLQHRFGEAYLRYKSRVPRYTGLF